LPLLYQGEQLLAVANLPGLDGGGGWKLHWQPQTRSRFELKGAFR
jgi:tRNA(Ile)-lysidine synthase